MKDEKKVFDYYQEGKLLFQIGKVNGKKPQEPIEIYLHSQMAEIIFLHEGQFLYLLINLELLLHSGAGCVEKDQYRR